MHDSSFSRRRSSRLKFRWALRKQCLSLEGTLAAIVTLYDDFNAGTKDVRNNTSIGNRKCLPSRGNDKPNELLLVVAHNRARLYNTCHTHRLSGTGGAVLQFIYSHIVDGIRLCIRIDKVDHRS